LQSGLREMISSGRFVFPTSLQPTHPPKIRQHQHLVASMPRWRGEAEVDVNWRQSVVMRKEEERDQLCLAWLISSARYLNFI
jgi:hypothetical protein